MKTGVPDRRKNKYFRFLYMDFSSFWNRIILRKKAAQSATAGRVVPSPQPEFQPDEYEGQLTATGVRRIDEQHQAIREAILGLQRDLRDGSTEQGLPKRLDALLQQMNRHFHDEEGYLKHISYAELQSHQAEHDQFRAHLLQLRERAEAGERTVPLELTTFLFNWFKQHNLQEEAAFGKAWKNQ